MRRERPKLTNPDKPNRAYTVLLGSVGPDCHSVGLTVLRRALVENGFRTLYMGTRNDLEDFFRVAKFADAVFVSSMDGHARQYLNDFPDLRREYDRQRPLWYVGGNLSIGRDRRCSAEFTEMGFDRVFVKFVDVATTLDLLRRDLHGVVPVPHVEPGAGVLGGPPPAPTTLAHGVKRSRAVAVSLPDRATVLGQWPTGHQAASLDASAEFLAGQPSFSACQRAARIGGRGPLLQPRCGVATADEQRRSLLALRDSGARVLSYQVDSLTRDNDYPAAERAVKESESSARSVLNGFPVVNHGVPVLRELISAVATPLQTRHSTRDPRLLAEISYAGGVTSYEGGPICYNIPYHKHLPLRESLARWAYVDRLTGLYHERYGIRIDREFFGVLTATLVPPCVAIVVDVLEMLLAVEHGVTSVSLGYAEQGNRSQDIAAIRVLRAVAEDTLRRFGHADVEVFTVFHQYMAAFPADWARSAQLIRASGATAALSGADRVLVKTPIEADGIPTLEDNVNGMAEVMCGVREAATLRPDAVRVADEEAVIRREVDCILDSVLRLGAGDLTDAVVRGFAQGWLDVPFAPSVHNQGRVLTARDTDGAVRFLDVGNLQLSTELRAFHEHRMARRRKAEGLVKGEDHLLVERDVLRIPRGDYDRWPLDGASG
jgi:methylaspartate mutase epsilon subunit